MEEKKGVHRACKRKREDGSSAPSLPLSPSCATCALWNRAASITARRCISHVGQTPLHAGNEIAYIRVYIHIYIYLYMYTYICCPSFVHPFVLYICARVCVRVCVCVHRGRGEGWTDGSRPCLARPIRAYRRIIYSNGASLAAPTATRPDRPTDFRHDRPYVHLCFLLFFVGSSFLFFFSESPSLSLLVQLFLRFYFYFFFFFGFGFGSVWRGEIGGFFSFPSLFFFGFSSSRWV